MNRFDLTYATVDSLSEGVGSSQIVPLIERLAANGMKINLISFEKEGPSTSLDDRMTRSGVVSTQLPFGDSGPLGGVARTIRLAREMAYSDITHARSDFPAVAARISGQNRILWDVRSLWADQRKFMEKNQLKKSMYGMYGPFENLACNSAIALSTLTNAIVPVLLDRHKKLPKLRTVVPTAVDLDKFMFSPNMPRKIKGLYSGTYNNYYDLELSRKFIEAIRMIEDCRVDWAKPKESQVKSLHGGEDSSFSLTQPEMASIMSEYSFGISICKENAGLSLKAAMPTKIAEFLAIGRPLVVNAGLGDCDEIIEKYAVGVVIRSTDDLNAKAREFIDLCKDPDTPTKCRTVAESLFSLDNGVSNYLHTYAEMLKNL